MKLRPSPVFPLAAVVLAACSSSDDGAAVPSAEPFTVDGFVQDAAVDELLAFAVDVTAVHLVDAAGTQGPNLLQGARRVELLGLQTSGEWLFRARPAAGTYTGARFVIDGGSVAATALDGSAVAVTTTSTTIESPFPVPLTVGPAGHARLVLDVDLSDSLSGTLAAPPLTFSPVVDSILPGTGSYGIDEFDGIVRSFDAAAGTVRVDAYVDDSLTAVLGEVTVSVPPGAVLVRDDDAPFATRAAFFAALVANSTLLEVHGALLPGATVEAQRIEVEDHQGGGGSSAGRVEIEGRVTSHTPGSGFDLLIIEVEEGQAIAGPVLAGLGSPSTLAVTYDGSTVFRRDDDHGLASSAELVVGQRVDVRFASFASSRLASRVELDGAADHTATITGIGGLPGSITVRLSPSEAAVTAGLVASAATDVTVSLGAAPIVLRAEGEVPLSPSDLVTGVRVNVQGPVTGDPATPSIAATRLRVRAGEFEGVVSGIDAGAGRFDATVSSIDDPLGGAATSPPFTVVLEPGCTFEGDASSAAGLFALFNGLQPGETLEVEVEGLGSATPNEVRAFHVEVEVD